MLTAIERALRAHRYVGSEMGGLSTSLGLFASPSLIRSTESVVVMEWKGMSTSRGSTSTAASIPGEAASVAIDVRMPFHSITTTDSVERISSGLAKNPSEVLNPPTSSPKDAGVAACTGYGLKFVHSRVHALTLRV